MAYIGTILWMEVLAGRTVVFFMEALFLHQCIVSFTTCQFHRPAIVVNLD